MTHVSEDPPLGRAGTTLVVVVEVGAAVVVGAGTVVVAVELGTAVVVGAVAVVVVNGSPVATEEAVDDGAVAAGADVVGVGVAASEAAVSPASPHEVATRASAAISVPASICPLDQVVATETSSLASSIFWPRVDEFKGRTARRLDRAARGELAQRGRRC